MGRFPAPPIYLRAVILSSAAILPFYFGRRSWPSDACGRRPLGSWAHTALPTPWQGHWHHLSRSEFLRAAPGTWQTWISEIWKVKIGGAHPCNDARGFGKLPNPPAKPSYNTYEQMVNTSQGGAIISTRPGRLRACCCCLWYWLRRRAQSIGDPDRAQPYGSTPLLYLRTYGSNLAWCHHFGTANNLRHTAAAPGNSTPAAACSAPPPTQQLAAREQGE